ncbi:HIT domain-containing protein [Capsaspora owczarzaki ATCC 30864]|uniref:HIT domain-containing protein n=2 Tax=Capsaspora owczarzaki (strain ATCC 30864) TaxID=595528 RepID=A0A0D2WXK1_CAPO3|nr:HIT domain-containing protein [Capsaspora owczarzaki ATCC 30864]
MLVAPLRVVHRFTDLNPDEIADLFQTTQRVSRAIEIAYKSIALTIAIQDGVGAGQTVEHVHVHIIPRHKDDFVPNDKIYHELDQHDKEAQRRARTSQEMADEATWFRQFLAMDTAN